MIADFYSALVISESKERIVCDVAALNMADTPRLAPRRTSDNKTRLEVDDIFALITFADENGLLPRLSRYVSSNPEQIPQIKWIRKM